MGYGIQQEHATIESKLFEIMGIKRDGRDLPARSVSPRYSSVNGGFEK